MLGVVWGKGKKLVAGTFKQTRAHKITTKIAGICCFLFTYLFDYSYKDRSTIYYQVDTD